MSTDFDTYYTIPSWVEPTAAEAQSFNNGDWCATTAALPSLPSITSSSMCSDIYAMTASPKIGAYTNATTSAGVASSFSPIMKPFNLLIDTFGGGGGDPDSKEERGARTATGSNAADAWASIVKDTNYGFNGNNSITTSAPMTTTSNESIDIIEAPRVVKTGAPCTAPSGTVWLSVGDAMDRTKQHDMWSCVSEQWTRVPTIWKNSETSVLSINASMSIMSAAALANVKRQFKKGYVPGSLPSSNRDDIIAQKAVAPTVAIAGVTPMIEPVTAPILLAEAPKKSGRGGGRKRCTLFPKEIKPRGAPEPLLTPTGRIRKQSVKKSTYVKKDKSLRKNAKANAAVDKKPSGVVDKTAAVRKNARRIKTNAKEVHHVSVTAAAAAAIAAIPVNIAAAAAATPTPGAVATITATAPVTTVVNDIPDISPFDFEEEMDTRANAPRNGVSMAAIDAAYAIGNAVAQRADTKLVTKVVYEEYLVDEYGNEVKLSHDGTLNGVPVNIRDEADVVR